MEEQKNQLEGLLPKLKNLPGVNQEYLGQSINKHFATLDLMQDFDDVYQLYQTCDKINVVDEVTGIINFTAFTRTKEEAEAYIDKMMAENQVENGNIRKAA